MLQPLRNAGWAIEPAPPGGTLPVDDGYGYAAVRVADPGLGTIVCGREPCFEEAEKAAEDLATSIEGLTREWACETVPGCA